MLVVNICPCNIRSNIFVRVVHLHAAANDSGLVLLHNLLEIFHLPDDDGCAVLLTASITASATFGHSE
jgi:hypothetical protein